MLLDVQMLWGIGRASTEPLIEGNDIISGSWCAAQGAQGQVPGVPGRDHQGRDEMQVVGLTLQVTRSFTPNNGCWLRLPAPCKSTVCWVDIYEQLSLMTVAWVAYK